MKTPTFIIDKTPTRYFINKENQKYIFFGGTSYLGLSTNKEFQQLYKIGIEKYGLNIGTSRTNNVRLSLYNEAEAILAERFGYESSILVSSGYLASQLALQTLTNKVSQVLTAPNTHPANIINHNSLNRLQSRKEWEQSSLEYILSSKSETFMIISNTLDNLFPEMYSFDWLKEIPEHKNIILLLDDSHGLGIIHENKSSISTSVNKQPNIHTIIVASLAKGLGTDAGLVLGDKNTLDLLRNHPIYLGASPPSPAGIYTIINGEKVYQAERNKLIINIQSLASELNSDFRYITDFPIFTYSKTSLYPYLASQGIVISSFPYPRTSDPTLERIVISSLHSRDDIKALVDTVSLFEM